MKPKIHTFDDLFEYNELDFDIRKIGHKEEEFNQTIPHCHDYYYIMFVSEGSGVHFIDCEDHKAEKASVFFVSPGQCHAYTPGNYTGYTISFKLDFVNLNKSVIKLYDYPFFHTQISQPLLHLSKEDMELFTLLDSIYKEFQSDLYGKRNILRASLEILLLRLSRIYGVEEIKEPTVAQIDTQRIRILETLIDQHFIDNRKVDFYAEKLNITSRHLNTIVKRGVGKSISDLIQARLLVEAKRMLLYSNDTVSEIAWKLNFSDKAYFHRLFKTNTSYTPEGFRDKFLKVH